MHQVAFSLLNMWIADLVISNVLAEQSEFGRRF